MFEQDKLDKVMDEIENRLTHYRGLIKVYQSHNTAEDVIRNLNYRIDELESFREWIAVNFY